MDNKIVTVTRAEFYGLLIVSWLLAGLGGWSTVTALGQIGFPLPVRSAGMFFFLALALYPIARVWYRMKDHALTPSRYFAVALGISVLIMFGIALTS